MRRITLSSVVVAFVAAVALAGCGDDGDTLSEEEFQEQANEICAEGSEELEVLAEDAFGDGEEPSTEQVADFADEFAENIEAQIDDIADLNPPDEIADEVDEVLDDAREALDQFVEDVQDDPSVLESEEDPFADVNERLADLGLDECAG